MKQKKPLKWVTAIYYSVITHTATALKDGLFLVNGKGNEFDIGVLMQKSHNNDNVTRLIETRVGKGNIKQLIEYQTLSKKL